MDKKEKQLEREMLAFTEATGRNWWSGFQPRHLTLKLIKSVLNYTAPRVKQLAPERKPTLTVTEIVERSFRRIMAVLEKEEAQNKAVRDRHFRNLVEAARRALIYVAEEDCYYRDWLALLLMVLYGEIKTKVDAWDPASDPRIRELKNVDEILARPGGKELLFYWSLRYTLPIVKEE